MGQELVEVSTSVCCTVETLYNGHHWDPAGCPVQRSVPNSEVDLYTALCVWGSRHCIHWRGVINSVSFIERFHLGSTVLFAYMVLFCDDVNVCFVCIL